MILELLLPAILPAAMDGVKNLLGGISRRIGGLSVEDQLKIETAGIEKLKALADLDTPVGTPSQWVVDLRASFRYIAAGVSILTGSALMFYNPLVAEGIAEYLIGAPFAFIFGERMYLGLRGTKK
jgi:hypothetical protein